MGSCVSVDGTAPQYKGLNSGAIPSMIITGRFYVSNRGVVPHIIYPFSLKPHQNQPPISRSPDVS